MTILKIHLIKSIFLSPTNYLPVIAQRNVLFLKIKILMF